MSQETLTHKDAELVLKLYELRREQVMRESRNLLNGKFWPKCYADVEAVLQPDHEMNAAWRQVTSYWEMVYGFAKHGIIQADFLVESNGEGLFLFSKIEPYLDELRKNYSPIVFLNAEWLSKNSSEAARRLQILRERIRKMMAK